MTEVVYTKSQEEYEDDFEKDLDWLISEESRSEDQGSDFEDIEAEIDKELEEEEILQGGKTKKKSEKKIEHFEEDEERWPSPMEPLEYDSDQDCPSKLSPVVPPPPETNDQTDEEKKYILEKIQQANRELQEQETPDMTRRRRLHFKETLVDLVVPAFQFEKDVRVREVDGVKGNKDRTKDADPETEVSGKMSELKLSPRDESRECRRFSCEEGQGTKEGRVLVEKDGKFDLVSIKEVESQNLLPPIANNFRDCSHTSSRVQQQAVNPGKTHSPTHSPGLRIGSSSFHQSFNQFHAPRPPPQPRIRPNSATHSQRVTQDKNNKRRVQSATGTPCQATYTLSQQQKDLLQRIQEKKARVAREAEHKKNEQEEQKRQENEQAFQAWLMRKRKQLLEERRIHRAQEIERTNCNTDLTDSEDAFRLWLQRKREQQQKERQLVEIRRLEEDSGYLLHSREECERAFKLWLRRKQEEKRVEQQAAREQSRRLVLEERRARRMRDLLCTINETKPFRFTEQLAYRF